MRTLALKLTDAEKTALNGVTAVNPRSYHKVFAVGESGYPYVHRDNFTHGVNPVFVLPDGHNHYRIWYGNQGDFSEVTTHGVMLSLPYNPIDATCVELFSTIHESNATWGQDYHKLITVRLGTAGGAVPASRRIRYCWQANHWTYRADYDSGKGYAWPIWSSVYHSVKFTATYVQSEDMWMMRADIN